jgi:copper chaperone CopZ
MQKNIYTLKNLTCEACVKLSKMKISKIPGVHQVEINLQGKTEILAEREIAKEEIQKALTGTDYQVV